MKKIFVTAAIATFATGAYAAQSTTSTSTTSTTLTTTPAAGQSTTTVDATKAAKSPFSMSFVSEFYADAENLNYSNVKNKSYGATSYAGAGYKINDTNRVGVRQYFTYDVDGAASTKTTTLNDLVFTYGRNVGSFLGADPTSVSIWYYVPTSDASRDARSNGQLRLDYEMAYTLNPKWTVSYYLNPRQNFIPDSSKTVKNEETGEESVVKGFSRTTLLHYGYLYYNHTDAITSYTYAGFKHRWQTTSATLNEESLLAGVGTSFSFLSGKVTVNPEVASEVKMIKDFKKVASSSVLADKNISYALVGALSF